MPNHVRVELVCMASSDLPGKNKGNGLSKSKCIEQNSV